jgi:hypothetical protein
MCAEFGSSGRQTPSGDCFHNLTESIQFIERSIEIWSNTKAAKFFVDDRGRENSVLIKQIAPDFFGIHSFDVHICDGARLIAVEGRIEPNSGQILQPVHPIA